MREVVAAKGAFVGADLTGADLSRSTVSGADFTGARLVNARLRGADLGGVIAHSVDFGGADLVDADLTSGDFRSARFAAAILDGARLTGGMFRSADFTDASMIRADIRGVDLSRALGLVQAQIALACGDQRTRLATGLTPVRCGPRLATAVYVARTAGPSPLIDHLSPGRLEIVNGCLTALVRGARFTAVFPADARLEIGEGGAAAILFEGRKLPIDESIAIPGGPMTARVELVAPSPASCPRSYFGLGG